MRRAQERTLRFLLILINLERVPIQEISRWVIHKSGKGAKLSQLIANPHQVPK